MNAAVVIVALYIGTVTVYAWRILTTGVKWPVQAVCHLVAMTGAYFVVALYFKGTAIGFVDILIFFLCCLWQTKRLRPVYVDVNNKAVFITGCDSGFGHALAKRLEAKGLKVFAACQFPGEAGERALMKSSSSRLRTVPLDVTDDDKIKEAVKFVQDNLEGEEKLWCLVNNAGMVPMGELEIVPMRLFEKAMNVNCFGQVRMTKAFLPLIRATRGRIVNVASVVGKVAMSGLGVYSMSKFGVEAFSDVLRQEMQKWGVQVSLIEPGPYVTGLADPSAGKDYMEQLWEDASEEVKESYGKDFFDAYYKMDDFATDKNITPVLDGMEDAILSPDPQSRYTMGSGSWLLPFLNTVCQPLVDRSDTLHRWFTIHTEAIPAALKQKLTS